MFLYVLFVKGFVRRPSLLNLPSNSPILQDGMMDGLIFLPGMSFWLRYIQMRGLPELGKDPMMIEELWNYMHQQTFRYGRRALTRSSSSMGFNRHPFPPFKAGDYLSPVSRSQSPQPSPVHDDIAVPGLL